MKFLTIFISTIALCTLCGCNDIECIGDDGHTRTTFGIIYAYRNYECKDGTRFQVECGTAIELRNGDAAFASKKRDCSRFTTKDNLIKMNAKKR